MMTPDERIRAAKALDANPLLEECFEKAVSNCFQAWQADPSKEDRDVLWNRMKATQLLRNEIYAAVKSTLRDGR
jgi:hypothetical protein